MVEGLEAYIKTGRPPGSFLLAVLRNDFVGACNAADDWNLANLPAYASYLYTEAPCMSHGSREIVEAWMDKKSAELKLAFEKQLESKAAELKAAQIRAARSDAIERGGV